MSSSSDSLSSPPPPRLLDTLPLGAVDVNGVWVAAAGLPTDLGNAGRTAAIKAAGVGLVLDRTGVDEEDDEVVRADDAMLVELVMLVVLVDGTCVAGRSGNTTGGVLGVLIDAGGVTSVGAGGKTAKECRREAVTDEESKEEGKRATREEDDKEAAAAAWEVKTGGREEVDVAATGEPLPPGGDGGDLREEADDDDGEGSVVT